MSHNSRLIRHQSSTRSGKTQEKLKSNHSGGTVIIYIRFHFLKQAMKNFCVTCSESFFLVFPFQVRVTWPFDLDLRTLDSRSESFPVLEFGFIFKRHHSIVISAWKAIQNYKSTIDSFWNVFRYKEMANTDSEKKCYIVCSR